MWKRARRRGAGERVSLVEQCCTACQLIAQDAYYSEGVHEVRTEILAALMRELPHTATATHLLDSLGSGEKWGNRGSPHYCYLREEVEACIDNCLMPSGVFDIAGGVVSLRSLRRREETGVRFRARRPRKMWTRDDMNILSQFIFIPQTKLPNLTPVSHSHCAFPLKRSVVGIGAGRRRSRRPSSDAPALGRPATSVRFFNTIQKLRN